MAARTLMLGNETIRRLTKLALDQAESIVSVVDPVDGIAVWCSERGLRRIIWRDTDEVVAAPPAP